MFLLVDETSISHYRTKVDRVLIGDWPDTDRIQALVEEWPVIRSGRYQVTTTLNGPAHILRVKVLQ